MNNNKIVIYYNNYGIGFADDKFIENAIKGKTFNKPLSFGDVGTLLSIACFQIMGDIVTLDKLCNSHKHSKDATKKYINHLIKLNLINKSIDEFYTLNDDIFTLKHLSKS